MKTLSGIAVSPSGLFTIKEKATQNPHCIYRGIVRGTQYYQLPYMYHHLSEGAQVTLTREVNNLYDAHAVAVYYKHFLIGFLPAAENGLVSRYLDQGMELAAYVSCIKRERFMPPTQLEIEVVKNV